MKILYTLLITLILTCSASAARVYFDNVVAEYGADTVDVDLFVKQEISPAQSFELISYLRFSPLAIHTENLFPLNAIENGREFDDSIFNGVPFTYLKWYNPDYADADFIISTVDSPWNILADGKLATVTFDIRNAPAGVYTVTPDYADRLFASVTTNGDIYYIQPSTSVLGSITIHTPEPDAIILSIIVFILSIILFKPCEEKI